MSSFQTGFGGGVGTAFPPAASFPHYAIQQGMPYNVYGYASPSLSLSLSPPLSLSLSLSLSLISFGMLHARASPTHADPTL
jgi:hypothetical protein